MQTKQEKAEYQRRWIEANRGHVRERNRKWEQRNQDKKHKSANESYHRNKEKNRLKRLARAKAWYVKNKVTLLPLKVLQYRERTAIRRGIVFRHYGKKCACCGFADERFLTIDHVFHGKGNRLPRKERKTATPTILQNIIDQGFPSSFQLLCMNCNWAKAVHKVCPHQLDNRNVESIFQ